MQRPAPKKAEALFRFNGSGSPHQEIAHGLEVFTRSAR